MISYFKENKNKDDIYQYKQTQLTFGTTPSGSESKV
jgi:hypothetical protein